MKEYFKKDFFEFTQEMFKSYLQTVQLWSVYSSSRRAYYYFFFISGIERIFWLNTGFFKGTSTKSVLMETFPTATVRSGISITNSTVVLNSDNHIFGSYSNSPSRSQFEDINSRWNSMISTIMKGHMCASSKYSGKLNDDFKKQAEVFDNRCHQCDITPQIWNMSRPTLTK